MHIIKKLLIKKWLLALSISINVGLLLFFKYANFFVENVNGVLSGIGFTHFKWTEIILPIGISFYTFQTLTYSIDVYRKVHEPLKTVKDYLVYIMLFPQMIAGPIVRFNKIADQIENRQDLETIDNKLLGFFRFVIGLAKKVLIANVMGAQADNIFSFSGDELTTSLAWIGIVAYSLQIYFDFSGYSDMAIGIGRMIGFKFPENFNNPYISRSISEFWRRWHITLSSWMRDYLYIPLGGSRVNNSYRLYFNLWIVFLISGLWHGAAWNFVIWGAYHGLFLILDKMFLLKVLGKIGKYPSIIFTHFVTLVGWVIFRAESYEQVKFYLSKMFVADMSGETIYFDAKFWSIMLIGLIFSFIVAFKPGERLQNIVFYTDFKIKGIIVMAVVSVVLLLLSIGSITSSGFNPFIYFRF
ncbi:MAG: MBOAT family protein [Bacteroidales bacterium]|nr:MBOAT family protein [Bacteroidales bacterium]